MPVPPSAWRVLTIIGYAGWAAILVGVTLFLFVDQGRGRDTMIGGAVAIGAKYLGTLVLVLLSRPGRGGAA